MSELAKLLIPELILVMAACALFLLGCSGRRTARGLAPLIALLALLLAMLSVGRFHPAETTVDSLSGGIRLDSLGWYIRLITGVVAVILLLLAWPTNQEMTGNSALHFGHDAGEFFALFLLSIAGLFLVTSANDLIVLFLALELVSVPTYVMVSISRPQAVAQEAGVKYFFLGAMSVALMIFGFSYLYGTTGAIQFQEISTALRRGAEHGASATLAPWQTMAVVMILAGFAFKMAAFPLHFYAGDVYEGAATPVTAFLAFVPKAAGFVALVRLMSIVGGESLLLPPELVKLLWIVAALTMTIGNVLGLLQSNVKRVLAYSSIAHSGYMLVGIAALAGGAGAEALKGVLFYLAAYGLMNAGAFGVLMLLPSRDGRGSAETFDDLAGQGRQNVGLGLAMAVSCFSLIGIPLTVGFLGKLLLIRPALEGGMIWLVIVLVANAAISAAYYLRIVGTMFLRTEAAGEPGEAAGSLPAAEQLAARAAVILSVVATLALGTIPQAAQVLNAEAANGSSLTQPVTDTTAGSATSSGMTSVAAPALQSL